MPRIAIFTDDPGWHGARLREALAERGYESHYVSLTECRLTLDGGQASILMPGFKNELPDGVFVRGVPGGTLDEVVFYLDILHALQHLGVKVYNAGRAIERTVDKGMTSFLLNHAGIPSPRTWVMRNPQFAADLVEREIGAGRRLVSKPLFGSQGEGVRLLESLNQLVAPEDSGGVYYLQEFIDGEKNSWHDWRVFVVNHRAVAVMRRCGTSWLNNVAQGARCEAASLEKPLKVLAEKAVNILAMDYAGVDIICDAEQRYSVIEVNSVPAWKGLQSVCETDIARLLADDFLSKCKLSDYPVVAA